MANDIEITAPAGSWESMMAGIQSGADSIYFGIENLNMRARSSNNFKISDLPEIVRFCGENQVKSYMTVNTVIYDQEISFLKKILDEAKKQGISAIVASDQGAINYASSIGLDVHISTQLSIGNIETVKFYSKFAEVMVLARELNLDQVREITNKIDSENITGPSGQKVKIEIFVHGALCMAISGKCYLSLHENNNAANRGACLQTCRKAYHVTEKESGNVLEVDNEFIMSPKDLCTIGFLNKILDSGVKILKIEGRARSPEYVKMVTKCYREAADSYFDGSYNQEKIDQWIEQLGTVFNRGFWDGYYLGQKLGEWSHKYGSIATKRKVYLAKCTNYFSKINVAEFQMETQELEIEDEVIITGPTTGVLQFKLKEIRVNEISVKKTVRGDKFSIPVDSLVRRSDKLYKVIDISI